MEIIDFLFKKEKKKTVPKIKIKDGIEYKYVKNKKSKTIRITIKDCYKVYISLPSICPYSTAEDFVQKRQDWIKEHIKRLSFNKIDANHKTKTDNLIITSGLVVSPVIKRSGRIIQFIYPIGQDFYSREMQEKAKAALKKALYIEAKEYLPKRIDELAQKFGFKYNKLAFKTHKTRWGSCSYKNNINLNINLMNLNDEFIDYVLIHELAHTVEKNHGEGFWNLVNKCMPNAYNIRKELKKQKSIV